MHYSAIRILLVLLVSVTPALALTAKERKIALHAKEELALGREQFAQAAQHAQDADKRADEAEQHARDTESSAQALQKQIDAHQKNEELLAGQVKKYKPFWDTGHKLWGIGAIGLGIGILLKHIFILIAVVLVLVLILWALSFAFPVIRPAFMLIEAFFASLFTRGVNLFKKHENP